PARSGFGARCAAGRVPVEGDSSRAADRLRDRPRRRARRPEPPRLQGVRRPEPAGRLEPLVDAVAVEVPFARAGTVVIHRYLDPDESLGELLFGLIMALTVTLGVRLLSSQDALKPHELAVALIGCNVAWGIIDGVLYLLGSLFSRGQRNHFIRKLRKVSSQRQA